MCPSHGRRPVLRVCEARLLVAAASTATAATARVDDDEYDDGRDHGERDAYPERASRDWHLDLSPGNANFPLPIRRRARTGSGEPPPEVCRQHAERLERLGRSPAAPPVPKPLRHCAGPGYVATGSGLGEAEAEEEKE